MTAREWPPDLWEASEAGAAERMRYHWWMERPDRRPVECVARITFKAYCPGCDTETSRSVAATIHPEAEVLCSVCGSHVFLIQEIPEILEREWK